MTEDTIRELATSLVAALSASGKSMTTAESCTGGWIAKAITDIPGSSACFAYGVVSYSNGAKESLLGVQNSTLEENGAVSGPAVTEMAEGALNLSGADIGVAVSGVAGPDGGTVQKPVGTVWFAWSVRRGKKLSTDSEQMHFDGNRDRVRSQTVLHALLGVAERVS